MGRSAKMDPLPHKFPAAIKKPKGETTLTARYGGSGATAKSNSSLVFFLMFFFPIQTFEAQIQTLPLISITERQKTNKKHLPGWTERAVRLQMRRVFFGFFFLFWVLSKNQSANKGFITSIKRHTEEAAARRGFYT